MDKIVYICLDSARNAPDSGVLGVFENLDKAKASWILTYHKLGDVTLVEHPHLITKVYHPLDKNFQVGEILGVEVWNTTQHL